MATQATPAKSEVLKSLLRADFTVQWRNRRASILVLLVPLIILVSWKGIVAQFGGPFALASCITFGIVAVGLMGYSNTVARDREKGVFQRLRVTPAAPWQIMTSRLIVQVAQIVVMTIVVFVAGYFVDNIALTPLQYVLTTLMAIVSASVYLGLGQALVGLIASSETLNAVTRLVYFAFIIVGVFGELGFFGKVTKNIVVWSPYGTVKSILNAAMVHSGWTGSAWLALLVTLAYAAVFAGIGIKYFKWVSA
jgi:ABC-2 type transport system permease protein